MIFYILIIVAVFICSYFVYGKFLEKNFEIKEDEDLPSKKFYDGVDFVSTNKIVLLGHHFSSIAGAGPIVGPILAGLSFGWLPAILWIVLGTIFVGGVHDFSSLIISVRHQGWSVAQVANKYVNKTTYKIFLLFIWLALMYVVAVFLELTAESFVLEPSVAQVSILYVFIAIMFGVLVYKIKISLSFATIISLVLIILGILYNLNYQFLILQKHYWMWLLLGYSLLASILPVWFLLQPRDYLSSYFLYFSVVVGLVGLIFGKNQITYPYFVSFYSKSIGPLVPFMFITIACGAISGFHSLVSSGTTSKQLDSIKNARFVSYGGMILEGIVATVSLSTLMIISKSSQITSPQQIYALGVAKFVSILGINPEFGKIIGYLTISVFVLTTLDTATRIARYIFQELIGYTKEKSLLLRIFATIISLLLPIILLNFNLKDLSGNVIPCWKVIWPLFGTTNQLLAALVLLIVYVWVRKQNYRNSILVFIPMIFMLIMTLLALIYTLYIKIKLLRIDVITISALLLLVLAVFVVFESVKVFYRKGL